MAGGFGPARLMGGGGPVDKSLNFGPSARRLLGELRPERVLVGITLALGAASVGLSVLAPRLLGDATNIIFAGVIGKKIPAGLTQAQMVARLRQPGPRHAGGHAQFDAPGARPGRRLRPRGPGPAPRAHDLPLFVTGQPGAGAVDDRGRAAIGLPAAGKVQAKLSRLPLSYFDGQPLGEVLSRVTNDIDNIAQTLQQTLSQVVTSLLMIVGVLISDVPHLPAAGRHRPRHRPGFGRGRHSDRQAFTAELRPAVEDHGKAQRPYRGDVHGPLPGEGFRARRGGEEIFAEHNDALFASSFKAQFVSGIIQPAMSFIGNINYVLVAVVGGLRVASGQLSLGDVQAFIQYSRQFTQPLTQVASMANLLQSGVASAERVFALLDATEQGPTRSDAPRLETARGRVDFEHVSFRYVPDVPLIEDLSLSVEPGQTVAIVGPTGAGKTTLVNLLMRFYELNEGRITLDGVDIAKMTPRGPALQDRAWCCRTPGCSAGRSPTTSPTAPPVPPGTRSRPRPWPPTSTTSCGPCPTATTP